MSNNPYIRLLPFAGIGIAVVAILIAGVFRVQRGAHKELRGSILKVRTLALEEKSSVAVIDFRFTNPSDHPFDVREVQVILTGEKGNDIEGVVIAEVDAQKLFEYYPALGQKFNQSLVVRTRVKPRESMDRMIAARFDLPESDLAKRKQLRIRIEEIDGPTSDIVERQ